MKKIYILLFVMLSFLCFSQLYSSLLKNADWTITKVQCNGVNYYPPIPFTQSGKVAFNFDENNGFKSTFYNWAIGKVTFGNSNQTYFSLQNITGTLVDYYGENEVAVNEFDNMVTNFYLGYQPTDHYNFVYEQIFSGKNLTVTNPIGNKIFYSNLILGNSELSLNKGISIYPNPAKNEFFFKSNQSILGKVSVEIFDASGKLVSSQKMVATEAVNTQALPNGVYVVKVTGLRINYSSKLMIKK